MNNSIVILNLNHSIFLVCTTAIVILTQSQAPYAFTVAGVFRGLAEGESSVFK